MFSSFGTVFVLNLQGKLLYRWKIPDQVSSSSGELVTIAMTLSGGSATAITVAPEGDRVWVGGMDCLYEIANKKILRKTPLRNAQPNQRDCLGRARPGCRHWV